MSGGSIQTAALYLACLAGLLIAALRDDTAGAVLFAALMVTNEIHATRERP